MSGPRILLTLSRLKRDAAPTSHQNYRQRLLDAGAEPISIYPDEGPREDFDALVLSGGGDIHPDQGGTSDHIEWDLVDIDRDRSERRLVDIAVARRRPILGICRGFQLLSVVHGGKLVPHVERHRPTNGPIVPHRIRPVAGSLLSRICAAAEFSVNSRHHQAVTALPEPLVETARVGDLVEAFEARDGRWIVGVQWHPESKGDPQLDEAPALALFNALVEAAQVALSR